MDFLGIKMVACSKLYLPGDFRQRVEAPHIPNLARSIDALDGPIHEPIVRKSDGRLICGTDRVAAHFFLKRDMIRVKLVECTDEEAEKIAVDENFHRRHSLEEREALLAEATRLQTRIAPFIYRTGKVGRPKEPATLAREEVAARTGVSPAAIRKQEQRKRKEKTRATSPVRDLGMKVDADWRMKVAEAQRILEDDSRSLRLLQTQTMKLLYNDEALVQKPRVKLLLELVTEAADLAKELIPSCLCPACKGLTGAQEKCPFCFSTGYVSKGQEAGIPKELWDEDKACVDGKVVPLSSLVEPIAEPDIAVDDEEWPF